MTVTLVQKYNPEWPDWFKRVKAFLAPALDGIPCEIEHLGSTSIPGMTAKPVIDIIIVFPPGRFPEVKATLEGLAYFHQGDLGLPGREAFDLRDPVARKNLPRHYLYTAEPDCHELHKHHAFRDYMKAHPDWARKLSQLKWDLAIEHDNDIYGYMDGKDAMVKEITALGFQESGQGAGSGD